MSLESNAEKQQSGNSKSSGPLTTKNVFFPECERQEMARVCMEIFKERARQIEKHGNNNYDDGLEESKVRSLMIAAKNVCDVKQGAGSLPTFSEVLVEEVLEALSASSPEELEKELIEVATVAVTWAAKIRQRR